MNDGPGTPPHSTRQSTALAPAAPRRALWLLAALVTLAHWLVLADGPWDIGLNRRPDTRLPDTLVFDTRRIEAAPLRTNTPPAAGIRATRVLASQAAVKTADPVVAAALPQEADPVVAAALPPETDPVSAAPETPALSAETPAPPASAEPLAPPAGAEAQSAPASAPPPGQAPVAVSIPGSVRLQYKLTGLSRGLNYHANGEMSWLREGDRYEASMVVSAFLLGTRSLSSVGEVNADGLAPKRFGDKSRSELAAHFDASQGKISFSANRPDVPWQRGAQDRLSVFFQLAGLLAGQPGGVPTGTRLAIYTVGPRDADTWAFNVEGEETLSLPMGELRALRLTREPRREFDQKVEAWFAPTLAYWPVRIKITQSNGDFVDQQLASSNKP
jgi:hypothetical protein